MSERENEAESIIENEKDLFEREREREKKRKKERERERREKGWVQGWVDCCVQAVTSPLSSAP